MSFKCHKRQKFLHQISTILRNANTCYFQEKKTKSNEWGGIKGILIIWFANAMEIIII